VVLTVARLAFVLLLLWKVLLILFLHQVTVIKKVEVARGVRKFYFAIRNLMEDIDKGGQ
jgi:hypothetical protein